MTIRLYLETNFLLSHAFGRDPATSRLIATRVPDLEIAIPTCCVMEALTNLEAEQKRINHLLGDNRTLIGELERNLASPHAAKLADLLGKAKSEWELGYDLFENRLSEAIHWLSDPSAVTCLEIRPAILASFRPNPAKLDPTDALILATILDDAAEHPSTMKVLSTENRRCFHDNKFVREELQAAGLRYFQYASKFLEWYDAQAES